MIRFFKFQAVTKFKHKLVNIKNGPAGVNPWSYGQAAPGNKKISLLNNSHASVLYYKDQDLDSSLSYFGKRIRMQA